jgi:hypothetical protein
MAAGIDNPVTRRTWALFILGCLSLYALAPRLVLLAFSWIALNGGLRSVSLATADAYTINALERIRRVIRKLPEITDAAPAHGETQSAPAVLHSVSAAAPQSHALVPFELREPLSLAHLQGDPHWSVFANVVDEPTQQAVLEGIRMHPVDEALLVFDARNTADRGAFRFIDALFGVCGQVRVVLHHQEEASSNKRLNWRAGLQEIGIDAVLDDIPVPARAAGNTV